MKELKSVVISRVDAIGDVTLTLPICGYLKQLFPRIKIIFLARDYTRPVIEACSAVDHFINDDELKQKAPGEQLEILKPYKDGAFIHVFPNKRLAFLARKAGFSLTIGTRNRLYHWLTCNKLVKLSRKNSFLHEAQLNLILLNPLGVHSNLTLDKIYKYYDLDRLTELPAEFSNKLSGNRFNLVIHPKSNGNGREWSLHKYKQLIELLPPEKFNILITGSEKESNLLKRWALSLNREVVDLSGTMTLTELIAFLHRVDGLLASGTGPLHLAAASGIHTLGLFPPIRPIHAERWAPVGAKAEYIESQSEDMDDIPAVDVCSVLNRWINER